MFTYDPGIKVYAVTVGSPEVIVTEPVTEREIIRGVK